jgi:hypothetical protein
MPPPPRSPGSLDGSLTPSPDQGLRRRLRAALAATAAAVATVRRAWPPTTRGLLLAGMAGAALKLWGNDQLDHVLYVAGILGLALPVLATLLVTAVALWLRRRVRLQQGPPRRLEASTPQRSGFALPALRYLPFITVGWRCTEPQGLGVRIHAEDGQLVEELRALRRTHVDGIRREVDVEDVFGLARITLRGFEAAALTVLPDPRHLTNMPVLQAISGGDAVPNPRGKLEGDRMDIRAYVPGDSVRNILWKAYARTRELNVRVAERAIAPTRRLVAYLLAGPEDEASAAAARVALERGLLGPRWAFGADGTPGMLDDLDRALLAVARSGAAQGPSGLMAFVDEARRDGRARCLVFLPPLPGPALDVAVGCAKRNPGALSFVVGTDGVRPDEPAGRWRRMIERPVADPRPTASELSHVLRALAAVGAEAVVVDRSTGRFYGQEHRQVWESRAV